MPLLMLTRSPLRAAELTIAVVEKSADPKDKTNDQENSKDPPPGGSIVTASSLADAAAKVLAKLGAGDCIKNLHFRGHAAPGVQGVGDGVNYDADKEVDTGDAKWKTALAGLKGKFCAGATIQLWGCNVGSCDKGATKLKEIADFFGVKVRGAVNKVTAGGQNTYAGPIQEADPDKPKPEHKAASDEKAKKKTDQKCDTNYDGDIDTTDINAIVAARNTPAQINDRRDTDNDGTITLNDARMCTLQCTRRLCVP